MRFAAVIVTHDRLALLTRTLPHCLAEPFEHVIIVDNASRDGTPEFLATQSDPRLDILTLPENTGGAGGFAIGMERAAALGVDWIVLFDDDAYPCRGALAAFETHLPNTAASGMIAARVETQSGARHPLNRPTRVPFLSVKAFANWITGTPRFPVTSGPVDTLSFVGAFIRPETIRRHGLPDPRLFIGGDDTAYALRLGGAGLVHYYLEEVRFTHLGGLSDPSPTRAFYSARNRVLVTLDLMPWLLPFVMIRHYLRTKSRVTARNRAEILRATRRGMAAGIRALRAYRSGAPLP